MKEEWFKALKEIKGMCFKLIIKDCKGCLFDKIEEDYCKLDGNPTEWDI